jgi:hypothetical protein
MAIGWVILQKSLHTFVLPVQQNAIASLQIIYIPRSHQLYVAIDNQLLLSSGSWVTWCCYLMYSVRAADYSIHMDTLQSNSWWCIFHLYYSQDEIQVTRVFKYSDECQVQLVLNKSFIPFQECDFEMSLQLPWEMTIPRAITPPWAMLYPHAVAT